MDSTTAQALLDSANSKRADGPIDQRVIDAARAAVDSDVRRQAWDTAARVGVAGLGAGAALRGLYGLFSSASKPDFKYQVQPSFVSIPYPVKKKEQETAALKVAKTASQLDEQTLRLRGRQVLDRAKRANLQPAVQPPQPPQPPQPSVAERIGDTALEGANLAGAATLGGAATAGGAAYAIPKVQGVRDIVERLGQKNRMVATGGMGNPLMRAIAPSVERTARQTANMAQHGVHGLDRLLGLLRGAGRAGVGTAKIGIPVGLGLLGAGGIARLSQDKTAATTLSGVPWFLPAVTGLGLGATYGGWKGMGSFLQKRKEAEQQRELDAAKKDFETAMLEQYDHPLNAPTQPTALGRHLKVALDATYAKAAATDEQVKNADLGNLAGQAAGAYGTYALLSGLGGGMLGYEMGKKFQSRRALAAALKQRARQRMQSTPPEIVAVPKPVETVPELPHGLARSLVARPELANQL